MNLVTIIEAWKIANNPTDKQLKLANERAKICETCPSKKIITQKFKIGAICGECGCPITKKIFTNHFNPCPLKKWEEIDTNFFNLKNTKTVI